MMIKSMHSNVNRAKKAVKTTINTLVNKSLQLLCHNVRKFLAIISALMLSLFSNCAFAGTMSEQYAWDTVIKKLSDNLSSNVVLGIAIIAIVVCGLTMAFTDLQSGGKRAVTIAVGLSVALGAASIMSNFFGNGALIF